MSNSNPAKGADPLVLRSADPRLATQSPWAPPSRSAGSKDPRSSRNRDPSFPWCASVLSPARRRDASACDKQALTTRPGRAWPPLVNLGPKRLRGRSVCHAPVLRTTHQGRLLACHTGDRPELNVAPTGVGHMTAGMHDKSRSLTPPSTPWKCRWRLRTSAVNPSYKVAVLDNPHPPRISSTQQGRKCRSTFRNET